MLFWAASFWRFIHSPPCRHLLPHYQHVLFSSDNRNRWYTRSTIRCWLYARKRDKVQAFSYYYFTTTTFKY
jgi:hypothetical protein